MFRLRRDRVRTGTREDRKRYIDDLYSVFLGRSPGVEESAHWISVLEQGMSDRDVFYRFKASKEYELRTRVRTTFPAGHYHSPVVDPDEARKYFRVDRGTDPKNLGGISISVENMMRVWERLRPFITSTNFPSKKDKRCRYYVNNDVYPIGDATILRAMILATKPKRIIEIGSGFSSACMLDALDESGNLEANVTFVEPYPERLLGLLRPSDNQRCKIIKQPVQALDVHLFEDLQQNDILFIDSTHVLKTASDVHFELFEVMPRLRNGVLIHFHDVHYPFEYPESWIFDLNYSWNEIYAVRAFLMYNREFEIMYFNSFFASEYALLIDITYPQMLRNPGGSLWLRKMG